MINRAELKNFGPIEQLDWQNLGKINLIIGENGCGKSFLLKALYSAMRTIEDYKRGDNPESDSDILWKKLYWTFQTEKIGNLVNARNSEPLSFKLSFDDTEFSYNFNSSADKLNELINKTNSRTANSIYLPAKEVLSLFHVILNSRENTKLFGFDDTYVDLVKALLGKNYQLRGEIEFLKDVLGNDKRFSSLFPHSISSGHKDELKDFLSERFEICSNFEDCQNNLNAMLKGKVEYDNGIDRWYFKQGEQSFSMGETAEGIKKIAILDTLLENGYLTEKSIIFIDEPESNLHPQAISQLLDIIAILANHGIQFFLASHSYFVVKKLFLIAQEQKMSIPVLSYQDGGEWVQSDLLDEMPDNPIIDESIRLYEEEVDLAFK